MGGPQRQSSRYGGEESVAERLVHGLLSFHSVEVSGNKHTKKKLISVLLLNVSSSYFSFSFSSSVMALLPSADLRPLNGLLPFGSVFFTPLYSF